MGAEPRRRGPYVERRRLDTQLPVSAFAALQLPTKLGLKANQREVRRQIADNVEQQRSGKKSRTVSRYRGREARGLSVIVR